MPTPFNPLDAKLLYRLPTRMQKKSSWNEHIPLAMFLVEILQPRVIVELGTQRGVSYCAFCQAVEELPAAMPLTHGWATSTPACTRNRFFRTFKNSTAAMSRFPRFCV